MRTKKSVSMKTVVLLLAVVLLIGCVVGGTLAWLTQKTTTIENTFTVGNIDIALNESDDLVLKMVPGMDIEKDPVVTVAMGSEECWLFIEVEENSTVDSYLSYEIDDAWTKLVGVDGVDNVYYIDAPAQGTGISVLAENKVTVLDSVTKTMMDNIENSVTAAPKLSFTAYAVQKYGFNTAAEAWAEAVKAVVPTP